MSKTPCRSPGRAASTSRAPAPSELTRHLLTWYRVHQRPLPWRRTRDPYAIWVSEVMLQQTQVATVIDYYQRWMQTFPTLTALANADEDRVLLAWQGLGYYSRARRLLSGARFLLERHGRRIPREPDAWREVPGVGRYTAGAITSIAFGAMAPVVDGNVTRVLCRLYALGGNPQRAPLNQALWRHAEALLVPSSPGDVNQALMELGATVCTPKAPRCAECPWRRACRARAEGMAERYPQLPERPKATKLQMASGLVARQGRVLVYQQTQAASRWASMWLFPTLEVPSAERAGPELVRHLKREFGLVVRVGEPRARFQHAVTRYRINLHVYECQLAGGKSSHGSWRRPAELQELAMPAVQRKIADQLLGTRQ